MTGLQLFDRDAVRPPARPSSPDNTFLVGALLFPALCGRSLLLQTLPWKSSRRPRAYVRGLQAVSGSAGPPWRRMRAAMRIPAVPICS